MKSLERRFKGIVARHPFWSTYISFAEAVKGQNFNRKSIQYWFNKLVEKDDYSLVDKKQLIANLEDLNKPAEAVTK